jgi:hypothetical protein
MSDRSESICPESPDDGRSFRRVDADSARKYSNETIHNLTVYLSGLTSDQGSRVLIGTARDQPCLERHSLNRSQTISMTIAFDWWSKCLIRKGRHRHEAFPGSGVLSEI